jgi:hypothetical protein
VATSRANCKGARLCAHIILSRVGTQDFDKNIFWGNYSIAVFFVE